MTAIGVTGPRVADRRRASAGLGLSSIARAHRLLLQRAYRLTWRL